jgi:NAD(P)-dependent dehydrogenase (short-subunit alcohol dehydrogenase family)
MMSATYPVPVVGNEFHGKRVLVTGGTKGISEAIVRPREVEGIERHVVYTHVEGNFPDGTVDLTNRVGLRDGRIASLEFVPTKAAES